MDRNDRLSSVTNEQLEQLTKRCSWEGVIALTEGACSEAEVRPSIFFFRGNALLSCGRPAEALQAVELGLRSNTTNDWGRILQFKAQLALGRHDSAFDELGRHIEGAGDNDVELLKTIFVQEAADLRRYGLAEQMNEKRKVICQDKRRPKYAVAIQCFNKADTLDKLFSTLVACAGRENFGLVILQDSAVGSKHYEKYSREERCVAEVIGAWLPRLLESFGFVETIKNPTNKGTAPSCRRLLDFVSDLYEGFLFLEDDCLLAEDSLEWSYYHLEYSISPLSYWFATCESIFFNSCNADVNDEIKSLAEDYASRPHVRSTYVELAFVPSTCFISRREIWRICSRVRSFSRGPESLSQYLGQMGIKTISPVVPRAYDIGMLHDSGYSVGVLGRENVKELKSVYLTSKGALHRNDVALYKGDIDALHAATVNLQESFFAKLL